MLSVRDSSDHKWVQSEKAATVLELQTFSCVLTGMTDSTMFVCSCS
jgi:hypothetical protein